MRRLTTSDSTCWLARVREPSRRAARPTRVRDRTAWSYAPFAGVAVPLALAMTGCAGTHGTQIAADCEWQVRLDGIVYTSQGMVERPATRYAAADQAECHDERAEP